MAPLTSFVHSRTPTPPPDSLLQEDGLDHAFHFLKTASFDYSPTAPVADPQSASASLQTPPHSSPITAAAERREQAQNYRKRKRVVFGETSFDNGSSVNETPTNANGTGGKSQQPKSILKAPTMSSECLDSDGALPQLDGSSSGSEGESEESLMKMVASLMLQLKSSQPESHHDAYRTLAQLIKAQDLFGRLGTFKEQLPFLEETIRTDVTQYSNNTSDKMIMSLATEALKLAAGLIHESNNNANISISIDFQRFMVLNSIGELQTGKSPKQIVRLHVILLKEVKITEHMLSAEHATRLVRVLCDSNDRESSANFLLQRIHIFDSLLKHHTSTMIHNADIWMDSLISAMLAKNSHIRQAAITLGTKAGSRSASHVDLSDSLLALFERRNDKERKFIDDFVTKLGRMKDDEETKYDVPAIWSVVILLLRAKRSEYLVSDSHAKLLTLFQKCFNTLDPHLKKQAYWAWDKFVLFANPSPLTKRQTVSNICAVFRASNMRSHSMCKTVQDSSHLIHLYYALRPRQPEEKTEKDYHNRLSIFWHELVVRILHEKGCSKPAALHKILVTLFGNETNAAWDPQRALRTEKEPLQIDELPTLDPVWVRSNISSVVKVVEPLLSMHTGDNLEPAPIWHALLKSIAKASSREIIFSAPLRSTVIALTNLLDSVWAKGPSSLCAKTHSSSFVLKFVKLVEELGRHVHPQYLRDMLLTGDVVQQQADPKFSEARKTDAGTLSPVEAFMAMLVSPPSTFSVQATSAPGLKDMLDCLMQKFEGNQASKFDYSVSLVTCALRNAPSNPPTPADTLWTTFAEYCSSLIYPAIHKDGSKIEIYKCLLKLLEISQSWLCSSQSVEAARKLTLTIQGSCTAESEKLTVQDQFLMPLFERLEDMNSTNICPALMDSQLSASLESDFERDSEVDGSEIVDEFTERIWKATAVALSRSYDDHPSPAALTAQKALLETVASCLKKNSVKSRQFLASISAGLCFFVQQNRHGLASLKEDGHSLHNTIRSFTEGSLWPIVLARIKEQLLEGDSANALLTWTPIIIAGFRSTIRSIAYTTLDFWNQSVAPTMNSLGNARELAGIIRRLDKVANVARLVPLGPRKKALSYAQTDEELFPGLTAHKSVLKDEPEKGSWISQTSAADTVLDGSSSSAQGPASSNNEEPVPSSDSPSEDVDARRQRLSTVNVDLPTSIESDDVVEIHVEGTACNSEKDNEAHPEATVPTAVDVDEAGSQTNVTSTPEDEPMEVFHDQQILNVQRQTSVEVLADDSFAEALRDVSSQKPTLGPALPSTPRKKATDAIEDDESGLSGSYNSSSSTSEDQVFVDANSSPLRPRSANQQETPRSLHNSLFRSYAHRSPVSRSNETAKKRVPLKASKARISALTEKELEESSLDISEDYIVADSFIERPASIEWTESVNEADQDQDNNTQKVEAQTKGEVVPNTEAKKTGGIWKSGNWTYVLVGGDRSAPQDHSADGRDDDKASVTLRSGKRRKLTSIESGSPQNHRPETAGSSSKKRRRMQQDEKAGEVLEEPKTKSFKRVLDDAAHARGEREDRTETIGEPVPSNIPVNSSRDTQECSAEVDSDEIREINEALTSAVVELDEQAEPVADSDEPRTHAEEEGAPFDHEIAKRIRGKVLPLLQQALPELGELQLRISQHEDSGGEEMLNTAYSLGQLQAIILSLQQDTLKTLRGVKPCKRE